MGRPRFGDRESVASKQLNLRITQHEKRALDALVALQFAEAIKKGVGNANISGGTVVRGLIQAAARERLGGFPLPEREAPTAHDNGVSDCRVYRRLEGILAKGTRWSSRSEFARELAPRLGMSERSTIVWVGKFIRDGKKPIFPRASTLRRIAVIDAMLNEVQRSENP